MIARHLARRNSIILAALLVSALAAPCTAAPITGFVEDITNTSAAGWSCDPGSDQPGALALYAGVHRIGIFPNTIDRLDTSRICGPGIIQNGFQIDLTPAIAQQFYGQTNLSLFALSSVAPAALLPPATQNAANPYMLPSGLIASLSKSGDISGLIANAPTGNASVAIVIGGPAGGGGSVLGEAMLEPAGQSAKSFSFSSPELGQAFASSPAGYNIPVYAYFSRNNGPSAQLGSPAILGTAYQPLSAQVAQAGSQSGITTTIFTKWIPANMNVSGISGSITLRGNYNSFSEALVMVGYTADNPLICNEANQAPSAHLSPITRLAGFTIRSNDTNADTLPVNIALPYAMPLAGPKGTCLVSTITAGYLYLDTWSAKYTTATANLATALSPAATAAPNRFAEGIGSEFHFQSGSEPSLYTIVALKMRGATQLDAIAASVSASGITGGPAKSVWQPIPIGNWTANTGLYVFSAADCQALGLSFGNPTPYYTVATKTTPSNYVIPAAARLLLSIPLYGNGASSVQQTVFQSFPDESHLGQSRIILSADECLVALHNVSAPGNSLYGNLDFENQSTAYFHTEPN